MPFDPVTWTPHDVLRLATSAGVTCRWEDGINGGRYTFTSRAEVVEVASTFAAVYYLKGYKAGLRSAIEVISSQVEHDRKEGTCQV